MNQIPELIKQRRSVRSYDGRALDEAAKGQLMAFSDTCENPFGIPVAFRFLDANENGLVCPVVSGTDLYIGGKVKAVENACVAFGYSFERLILFAQSLGLGTVWLGGTMNRSAYEQAMCLGEDDMMPCATPIGYPARKMSIKEAVMRKAIRADERLPFEELFFEGAFDVPLTKEKAGKLAGPLEMVRLAPSAVNKQPWRVAVVDNMVHFYLKRGKGMGHEQKLDMQKIDMGIALCHFELCAVESGLTVEFRQEDPMLLMSPGVEYIASYRLL